MKNDSKIKSVDNRLLSNGWKGEMRRSAESTIVETVGVNGHSVEIRRYDLGGKIEFRFPRRDQEGRRHFRCCRTLEEAKQAAQDICSGESLNGSHSPAPALPAANSSLTHEELVEAARLLGVPSTKTTTYDLGFSQVCSEFVEAKRGKLQRGEIRASTFRDLESRVADFKELLGKEKTGQRGCRKITFTFSWAQCSLV